MFQNIMTNSNIELESNLLHLNRLFGTQSQKAQMKACFIVKFDQNVILLYQESNYLTIQLYHCLVMFNLPYIMCRGE